MTGSPSLLWERVRRWTRYYLLKIVRIKASPESIALGLATGVFVGCLPVIPFQTVLALAAALVLRCSKLTAALGTWVSNPANIALIYYCNYRLGSFFLSGTPKEFQPVEMTLTEIFSRGWELAAAMMLGGLLMAIPCALLTYVISVNLIRLYHFRRMERRLKKLHRKKP